MTTAATTPTARPAADHRRPSTRGSATAPAAIRNGTGSANARNRWVGTVAPLHATSAATTATATQAPSTAQATRRWAADPGEAGRSATSAAAPIAAPGIVSHGAYPDRAWRVFLSYSTPAPGDVLRALNPAPHAR